MSARAVRAGLRRVAVCGLFGSVWLGDASAKAARPTEDARAPVATAAASPRSDWCAEGVEALDAETCFVLPALAAGKPRRLLLYLHGVVPPRPTSPQKENLMRTVKRACERAGAAALIPRGLLGVGPRSAPGYWAWPTGAKGYPEHMPSLVARFADAKLRLEARAGAPFERVYVAGSSNGAYFVSALALRGDLHAKGFPVDGFGAMSGGSSGGRTPAALEGKRAVPFYVGFGSHDPDSKALGVALGRLLAAAKWPVKVSEHPLGHGAREVYLDEAFALWDDGAP